MKIAFVSNFFNHHQREMSDALFDLTDGQFVFIQTCQMTGDRISLGWSEDIPEYVLKSFASGFAYNKSMDIIDSYDVVIAGSAPEKMLKKRLKQGKLTFRYSERIFKKSNNDPLRQIKYTLRDIGYRKKTLYYLLSSAYAAGDYTKCGSDQKKMFKWGYFPPMYKYDSIQDLIDSKEPNSILWAGRFISWKHPEIALEIARRLKNDGIDFKMRLIGSGDLSQDIAKEIKKYNLDDYVFMPGSMSPETVRENMEKSSIFLFTSDRNEGWGAVLNEAMNSGCGVVANRDIGSAPFLIEDGKNGFAYSDVDELYERVKELILSKDLREKMGINAYSTITNTWNARVACERLIRLIENIENETFAYDDGPCSPAKILKN